jgi:curved DNA-binding protein CbpA
MQQESWIMSEKRNPYTILGLKQEDNPSQEEIRKAYLNLRRKHHPDKNPGNEEEATQKFSEVQAAYEFLSNGKYHEMFEEHFKDEENPLESAFEYFMEIFERIKPGFDALQKRSKEVFSNVFEEAKERMQGSMLEKRTRQMSDYLKSDDIEKKSGHMLGRLDQGLSRFGFKPRFKDSGADEKIGKAFNKLGQLFDHNDQDQDPEEPQDKKSRPSSKKSGGPKP